MMATQQTQYPKSDAANNSQAKNQDLSPTENWP